MISSAKTCWAIATAGIVVASVAFSQNTLSQNDSYKVQPGDTLEDFSHQLFDNKNHWRSIWPKNPEIKNPDLIYPDQKLKLDPQTGSKAAPPPLRAPVGRDLTQVLLRLEADLSGYGVPYEPQSYALGNGNTPQPQPAAIERPPPLGKPVPEYPSLWLFPRRIRVIATMGEREDSALYQVNGRTINLPRSGNITAKPFCLLRPIAADSDQDMRLYRVIARFFPQEDALAQPFALISRQQEARVGDQLTAACPPSLAAIRADFEDESGALAIPREEVTVYHPEMKQFILPGEVALWRLRSGALPGSIRTLRLYRRDQDSGQKLETARVEILQRSQQNLIVRYTSLANTAF